MATSAVTSYLYDRLIGALTPKSAAQRYREDVTRKASGKRDGIIYTLCEDHEECVTESIFHAAKDEVLIFTRKFGIGSTRTVNNRSHVVDAAIDAMRRNVKVRVLIAEHYSVARDDIDEMIRMVRTHPLVESLEAAGARVTYNQDSQDSSTNAIFSIAAVDVANLPTTAQGPFFIVSDEINVRERLDKQFANDAEKQNAPSRLIGQAAFGLQAGKKFKEKFEELSSAKGIIPIVAAEL